MSIAASMSSATMCIVFVHSTRMSAPAPSSARACAARMRPVSAQSPEACSASISAKSSESSSRRAEWNPPRRSRTSSFARRYHSADDSQLIPPSTPIVFIPASVGRRGARGQPCRCAFYAPVPTLET